VNIKTINYIKIGLFLFFITLLPACSSTQNLSGEFHYVSSYQNMNELQNIYMKEKTILVLIGSMVYIPSCECLADREYGVVKEKRKYENIIENREYGLVDENRKYDKVNEKREYGLGKENREYGEVNEKRGYGLVNENRKYGNVIEIIKCQKLSDGNGFFILSPRNVEYRFYDGETIRKAIDGVVKLD
jgi:hypothetical protein